MPQYTLYELAPSPVDAGTEANVSPFVFITLSDMALLGVPYNPVALTFPQIRDDLAKLTGNEKVTVPTLKTESGFVTDSWEIAKYLEKHHKTAERSLFFGDADAAHLDPWAMSNVALPMRPIFRPLFYLMQDPASQEYFVRVKYSGGEHELQKDIESLRDPAQVEKMAATARKSLQAFEEKLGANGGPFVNGARAGHADSAVFGWYLSGQVNAAANKKVWESDELPRVKKWVAEMKKATGLDPKFDVKI